LIGGALWLLERRPLLAGVAMGLLTYKPQFGLLFPLALAVTAQWRAFAAAAATAALLAGASAVAFGVSSWRAFPAALTEHGDSIFVLGELRWEKVETVFGLTRAMGSGPELAFGAQLATGILVAGAVYLAWRSSAPYSLKSALLAAGALAVTPYAFAYDFAALAIPVAFLAKDQIASGSLKGEQAVLVWICFGLVVIVLPINVPPLGPAMVAALIVLIVRRMIWHAQRRVLVDQGAGGSRNGGAGGDNIVW
jgi:arabinofuranan 3-O-arabinosyltransferase